jgi:hypothetical protein
MSSQTGKESLKTSGERTDKVHKVDPASPSSPVNTGNPELKGDVKESPMDSGHGLPNSLL